MKAKSILVACSSLDYILIHKTLQDKYILDKVDKREDIIKFRKEFKYDLLLIDVAFLKPDFEVISGIKELNVPVIALSSEPYDARDGQMLKAGCCACYIRPIRQELFAAFIDYWIQQYSVESE